MIHSQAGPIDPTLVMGNRESFGRPVPFQFRISWNSAFEPFECLNPVHPLLTVGEPLPTVVASLKPKAVITPPLIPKPAEQAVPATTNRVATGSPIQWEMVVPKMVRTAPRKAIRDSTPGGSVKSDSKAAAPSEPSAPNFYTASSSFSWGQQRSLLMKLAVAVAAAGGIITPVWRHFAATSPTATEIQTNMRAGGWARAPATRMDAGYNRSRELVVFRPSLKATDCRFEFDWKPTTSALGWVFRAQDTANYYAMNIRLLKEGAPASVSVDHFAVYHGVEGAHAEKVLVLPRHEPVLRVRTEIAGPTFTLYLGGTAAEYWTDARLLSGGLGFFEDWHQRAEVQTVRMSFAPGTQIQSDNLRLYMNAPVQ